jgi:transcriptional regulator
MYIPEAYHQTDQEEIVRFINANNFGILVSQANGRILGTHIPFVSSWNEGVLTLTSHLAKANPQWKDWKQDEEVLAIFSGPHAFISASWYHTEEVPTWNYLAAHVYAKIRIIEEEELIEALTKMVAMHERQRNSSIRFDTFEERTSRQYKGVVGIELTVHEMQAVEKLSQKRSILENNDVADQLINQKHQADHEIGRLMKNKNNKSD